jgi:SAM-dependent methyltransferase
MTWAAVFRTVTLRRGSSSGLADYHARYRRVRQHYRDPAVAADYETTRFAGRAPARRNRRELEAVARALARVASLGTSVRDVLDLPCGTGRLFPTLERAHLHFVGADISLAMMEMARTRRDAGPCTGLRLVQCDGERLPFGNGTFDCVVSLRFMFHLDASTCGGMLAEMTRVTRRWLIIDFRHKYTTRYLTRLLRQRLGMLRAVEHRYSRPALARELGRAGLRIVDIFPCRRVFRWFSDKWVVLIEVETPPSARAHHHTAGAG